jgi:site-specific recombinase XerD
MFTTGIEILNATRDPCHAICEDSAGRYVFMTERKAPMTIRGFHNLVALAGTAAKFPFPIHPHMLRHATGYKLANDGQDTRALQHYLGTATYCPRTAC